MKFVRLSALRTGRLNPQETSLVIICIWGWFGPRTIVRPEGLSQWEIVLNPLGIESATFRLVAQWLNQLRHWLPPVPTFVLTVVYIRLSARPLDKVLHYVAFYLHCCLQVLLVYWTLQGVGVSLASCIFFPTPDLWEFVDYHSRELRNFSMRISQFRGPFAKRFNDLFVHVDHVTDSPWSIDFCRFYNVNIGRNVILLCWTLFIG